MHWKLKAKLQNIVSLLPSSTSYAVYYWIQRNFGSLRRPKTIRGLTAGINTWKRIIDQGYNPSKKVFLEIGTGWIPLVPMVYWLMGAEKTITIDLNPYLKAELVKECLLYISENKEEVLNLLGIKVVMRRFDDLLTFGKDYHFSLLKFFDLCQVDYIAPGDAANTRLPDRSIDFHTHRIRCSSISP